MSSEKTDGIVIRQVDYSETSRVVSFFTRDFGRISAMAKGARRLKGPFEAALDLLAECQIVFIRKSSASLDLLTEARLLARFQPLTGSLPALYGGYYIAELLAGLTEEYDPHPALYDEARLALARLGGPGDSRASILRFELAILREIGQLPVLDQCIVCGAPVSGETSYSLWVGQGGLICRRCGRDEYAKEFVPAGSIAVLQRLATADAESIGRLHISPAQHKQLRPLVTKAISHALGRRPRTLRYLET
ncbi:MAG: DNA repair protein RecO [Planctomycetes bacterium]|nr:DNA repair protein RecO [Planctomycetota bacterium]